MNFLTRSSALIYALSTSFLLKTLFVRGFSASLHLVLILGLFISWVCSKIRIGHLDSSKQRFKKSRFSYYKRTLLCCFGLSVLNSILCLLSYLYWYRTGWSNETFVSLCDLVLRTIAWFVLSVYLRFKFPYSGESKLPLLLRIWWGFFFSVSCYSLVIVLLIYKNEKYLPTHYLASDGVSIVLGFFFCYVGYFAKENDKDALLEEPLLNGDGTPSSVIPDSNKLNGNEILSPYSNAGIFSILTFSWMGPLIAVGNKKTLDLADVPQLDVGDSVKGGFSQFSEPRLKSPRLEHLS